MVISQQKLVESHCCITLSETTVYTQANGPNRMVNWSLDDTQTANIPPPPKRRSSLKAKRRGNRKTLSNRTADGRVRKVINGEVVYVRIRKVKA